jgi:hypothetical protein
MSFVSVLDRCLRQCVCQCRTRISRSGIVFVLMQTYFIVSKNIQKDWAWQSCDISPLLDTHTLVLSSSSKIHIDYREKNIAIYRYRCLMSLF